MLTATQLRAVTPQYITKQLETLDRWAASLHGEGTETEFAFIENERALLRAELARRATN